MTCPAGIWVVPERRVAEFIGANPWEMETLCGTAVASSGFGWSSGKSPHGDVPSMHRHAVGRLWMLAEHRTRVAFLKQRHFHRDKGGRA